MRAADMEQNGYFDKTVDPDPNKNPLYAVKPIYDQESAQNKTGPMSPWDKTSWMPGKFNVLIDNALITRHSSGIAMSHLWADYQTLNPRPAGSSPPLIRIIASKPPLTNPNILGFNTSRYDETGEVGNTLFSSMASFPAGAGMVSDPVDQEANLHWSVNISLISSPKGNELPLRNLTTDPVTTYLTWLVTGDLAKPSFTYERILAALKYFEGSKNLEDNLYHPETDLLANQSLALPAIDLTKCRVEEYFNCNSPTSTNLPVLALSIPFANNYFTRALSDLYYDILTSYPRACPHFSLIQMIEQAR